MKKTFFQSMFTDESGNISSKRIVGTICALSLVVALIVGCFYPKAAPAHYIVSAVEFVTISLFFATSSDKISKFLSMRSNNPENNKKDDKE